MSNKVLSLVLRVLTSIRDYFRSYLTPGQSLVERLGTETAREQKKAEELRKVLEAKRGLARARAENTKLKKEIAGVNEKTVGKGDDVTPVRMRRY